MNQLISGLPELGQAEAEVGASLDHVDNST